MKVKRILIVSSSIVLSALLLVGAFKIGQRDTTSSKIPTEEYPLLAKRVQVDNPNNPQVNFVPLRKELDSYLLSLGEEASKVSLYFEYLPSGVSIHMNENNTSVAASLMKVPFVMSLYEEASNGYINLDEKIALKKEWLNSDYGTLYKKGAGYELTLREAAQLTLKDSDNTALLMIASQLTKPVYSDSSVFSFLDLEYDITAEERVLIGARSYSSILKCLYLACFNSKADSQEILSYLTESNFKNRLTAAIPADIKVAHKIGTFSSEFQSDCGIFYVPERNYILCVMVEGDDDSTSPIIAAISKRTYEFITNTISPLSTPE